MESVLRLKSSLAILSFAIAMLAGSFAQAARDYDPHSGYLADTLGERQIKYHDLELLPPLPERPQLRDKIFNEKLSKEFRDKYAEKFGRTEAEQVYYAPNRSTYYNDVYGVKGTPQEVTEERRKFGDFMIRRLTEYHVDDYMQHDPSAKQIYELKQRIQNVSVQVQQVRFDMQYSIAGNTFDVNAINPYLKTARVRLQMNQAGFGPGPVEETTVTLGRNITKTVNVEGWWATNDGIASLVTRKTLTQALATTLTLSTFTKDSGKSKRESLYLAGMNYTF